MFQDEMIGAAVTLPRLTIGSATTLAKQLLDAADGETGSGLPIFLERRRAELEKAVRVIKDKFPEVEETEDSALVEADLALDESWRLFSAWLGALSALPDGLSPDLKRLRDLQALLFSEPISAMSFGCHEDWLISEMRLKAMSEGYFEFLIERLGGGVFVTYIKIAHAKFADVYGIEPSLNVDRNPELQRCLDDLASALKDYIGGVTASAETENAASEFLSEALLEPIRKWTDTAHAYRDTVIDGEIGRPESAALKG